MGLISWRLAESGCLASCELIIALLTERGQGTLSSDAEIKTQLRSADEAEHECSGYRPGATDIIPDSFLEHKPYENTDIYCRGQPPSEAELSEGVLANSKLISVLPTLPVEWLSKSFSSTSQNISFTVLKVSF